MRPLRRARRRRRFAESLLRHPRGGAVAEGRCYKGEEPASAIPPRGDRLARLWGQEVVAATALLLVLVGVVVLVARPRAALNRVMGTLLVLRGGADLMYHLMRTSPTAADALVHQAVANWYEAPLPLLTVLLLDHLHPDGRARPWRRATLAAGVLLALLALPAMPWHEGLFTGGVRQSPLGVFYGRAGLLSPVFNAGAWLLDLLVLACAARVAGSALHAPARRAQAALVGLAFALPLGQHGGRRVGLLVQSILGGTPPWTADGVASGAPALAYVVALVTALLALAAVLASLPRLRAPFGPRGARAVALLTLGAPATGLLDAALATWGVIPSFTGTRFAWLAVSACCLGLALVRHDLAGLDETARRRADLASRAGLLGAAMLTPVALTLAFAGASAPGLAVAVLLGLGTLSVSPHPPWVLVAGIARALAAPTPTRAPAAAPAPPGAWDAGPAPTGLPARYRVERELGRGASGRVLLAWDARRGGHVVLKRRHADRPPHEALAEARALAAVSHPNVVRLLDVERAGDEVVLVLAHAEGGSVHDLLAREGPQPPARAAALAADLLAGLEALHAAGLVHGDVKPANVLLDARGRALVGDLGAARAPRRGGLDLTITGEQVLGSYATAAPECVAGERPSPRADVYAAGALLHRLLTGTHYLPLEGRSAFEVCQAILHETPRLDHPALPPRVAPVLARALAKRPEDRFASAAGMAEALRAAW